MNKKRINLAMSFNSNYMKIAYVSLLSLFENKKPDIEFYIYILHKDLTEEEQSYLDTLAHPYDAALEYILMEDCRFAESLPVNSHCPLETYYRLMLSEILPQEVDRLLYFDADIIFNHDISELYFTDFEGNVLCACPDVYAEVDRTPLKDMVKQEGCTYFNAGVLLYNMELYRQKYSLSTYLETAQRLQYKLYSQDQDLLNCLHFREVKILDGVRYNLPAWTMQHCEEATPEQIQKDVTVLHFAGMGKPWNGKKPHFRLERLWWDYAKKTPFYQEFLEKFMIESMGDMSVCNMVKKLSDTNDLLRKEIENCMSLLQQMSKFIQ